MSIEVEINLNFYFVSIIFFIGLSDNILPYLSNLFFLKKWFYILSLTFITNYFFLKIIT